MINKLTFYNNRGWTDSAGDRGNVSVEIDGDPYTLEKLTGLGVPDFQFASMPFVDQPGDYFVSHGLRPRRLGLEGTIFGATPSGYMENRKAFYKVFTGIYSTTQFPGVHGFDPEYSPIRGVLNLDGPGAVGSGTLEVEFFCSVLGQFDTAIIGGDTTSNPYGVDLVLHDPRMYEVTTASLTGEFTAQALGSGAVTPAGNYMTFPTYTIHGMGNTFTITNYGLPIDADGGYPNFAIDYVLPSGQTIEVDASKRTVTLVNGAVETDIYGAFSGDWVGLLPGRSNMVQMAVVSGAAYTKLVTTWKNVYITL